MKYLRSAVLSLALIPTFASADFCEILAGSGAASCRINANEVGATIFGNWLRIKPESATQPSTGKKGTYVSGTTPAVGTLGMPHKGHLRLTVECFAGERSVNIEALPYMLGLTNGGIKTFDLTFKVDNKPTFKEAWVLNWKHGELQAPNGSMLATNMQGALDLVVTTEGVVGRKSPVGYIYKVEGFDQMNAGLCK
jgi:hypothetical protein